MALASTALLGLGLSEPEKRGERPLTDPAKIVLDFRDRTVSEVVQEIEKRSGETVKAYGFAATKGEVGKSRFEPPDLSWRARKVTLESSEPVPFWQAIDRLAKAGRVKYRIAHFGNTGALYTGVIFEGEGSPPGLADSSGPFRVGMLGIRESHETTLVRRVSARSTPSRISMPNARLALAPRGGGSMYAELDVAAEPGLVCRRDGPLEVIEVVDEFGRDLRLPAQEEGAKAYQVFAGLGAEMAPLLRIPLKRFEPGVKSRTIKKLRGRIPVEIGRLQPKPAVTIPLGNSEGKTFQGGGVEFKVEKDETEPGGLIKLAINGQLLGQEEPNRRGARVTSLMTYQISVVDAQGQAVSFQSSSSGGDGDGALSFTYEYDPKMAWSKPPAEFRYYDLDRVSWKIPFKFDEVPLP